MASTIKEWKDKVVFVLTADGRIIVGQLVGHDQVQNLIMNDAHERVYSADEGVEKVPLGLYVIRGDNLCLIGEYDESKFSDDQTAPAPIPPIQQQIF
ncbi:Sm-like protein LSM8 [Seminavis robusta]|uniref:U6 snRNA-associated Sm-like protein LSm8 n=1 Tax=Seminavis robusta TaxID=568900 RepID=A0A9N8E5D4_9STRA|nr:Sm-like protein LSM8 [Seminavis robusta]|eukprot:Sro690_g187630.1 Sm-like protein LSM8 (97) ;mRNA; f:28360-28755